MTTTPPGPNESFGAGQQPYPGAQPPPPPPGYGAYPTDPAGYPPQRPPAPQQPASIALAVKLMLVGAGLSLLTLVYSLATIGGLKDDITERLVEDDANVKQSTIDAVYGVAITFAILFGLVGALLWVWMAWKNGQGRSWARVVATVFGGFNLVGLLFNLVGGNAETVSIISSVVSVVLAVGVLILLWRKESTQFYDAVSASNRLY